MACRKVRSSTEIDRNCLRYHFVSYDINLVVMSEITLFADAIKVKIKNNGLISYKLKEKDTQNRP